MFSIRQYFWDAAGFTTSLSLNISSSAPKTINITTRCREVIREAMQSIKASTQSNGGIPHSLRRPNLVTRYNVFTAAAHERPAALSQWDTP